MAQIPTGKSDLQKQRLFLLLNNIVKENRGTNNRSKMFGKILQTLKTISKGGIPVSESETSNSTVTSNGSIKESLK